MGTLLGATVAGVFITAIAPLCFAGHKFYALTAVVAIIYGLGCRRRLIVALSGILLGNQLVAIPLAQERTYVAALDQCALFSQPQMLRLRVVSLAGGVERPLRFDAQVIEAECAPLRSRRLQISWYTSSRLRVGQLLLVVVDFRPLASTRNSGLVDFELRQRRSGFVMRARIQTLVSTQSGPVRLGRGKPWQPCALWLRLTAAIANRRVELREKLRTSELSQRGALLALLTGDAGLLSDDQRQLLQATGTSHLLVISGLHVGIVATLVMLLLTMLQRLGAFFGLYRASVVFTLLAIVILGGYVGFVGAGASALRAFFMSVVALCWFRSGRFIPPGWAFFVAFIAVVILQPMASLSSGFWMSFGLVGWLVCLGSLMASSTGTPVSRIRTLVVIQFGLSAIMVPFISWLGLPVAPGAVLANLFAVPLVSVVIVPSLLLVAVFELVLSSQATGPGTLGVLLNGLYWLANTELEWLMTGLSVVMRWVPATQLPELSLLTVLLATLVTATALLPVVDRVVRVGACLALVSFYGQVSSAPLVGGDGGSGDISWGHFRLDVFDVGQGASVLVRTADQVLLYDTGARFPSGYSYADGVILPWLRRHRIAALDVLLISHPDNDHAGGARLVMQALPVGRKLDVASCGRRRGWRWAGVTFRILQADIPGGSTNNRSCVLIVANAAATVVLAGDIEQRAEQMLLGSLPRQVDVLLVPHHGSRTSSQPEFVRWLQPRVAIVSASAQNSFGHPHPRVRTRYRRAGSRFVTTAEQGSLHWSSEQPVRLQSAVAGRASRWQLGAGLMQVCDCSDD